MTRHLFSAAARLLLSGIALAGIGCAAAPPPQAVAVYADQHELSVLEGEWWGQYWSGDTGRSGRIRFSLAAEADRAYGDVLMQLAGRGRRDDRPSDAPLDAAGSKTLSIEFVRVDATTETISGTLEPYLDPDCDCTVETTFTGVVSRDVIEGTFVTRAGAGYNTRQGEWRVERRDASD